MYKIWKTLLLCLLCAALLLSCAACGDSSERSSSKKKRSDKDSDIFDSDYDPNYIVPGGKQLPDDVRIYNASPFSEGLAFVDLHNIDGVTYCINKKGEIVFEFEGQCFPYTDYLNGRVVLCANEKYFVCDTSGNLTSLDDMGATLGATRIEVERGELLDNGYFFLVKTQTDYTGSSDVTALANLQGDIIIDYTKDLNDKSELYFYNDVLCVGNSKSEIRCYWDLSNGSYHTDRSNFYIVHPSDFWSVSGETYRDERTGKTVLDLNEYENIELGEFRNGYAPVSFCINESSGDKKYYFTVLKESGNFCYEPIQIPEVKDANGKVITPGDGSLNKINRDENSFVLSFSSDMIAVFDTKGLVSTAPIDYNDYYSRYSDGVLVYGTFPHYVYLDLDGKLLFPQKID